MPADTTKVLTGPALATSLAQRVDAHMQQRYRVRLADESLA